jgi:hypothetical protein
MADGKGWGTRVRGRGRPRLQAGRGAVPSHGTLFVSSDLVAGSLPLEVPWMPTHRNLEAPRQGTEVSGPGFQAPNTVLGPFLLQ